MSMTVETANQTIAALAHEIAQRTDGLPDAAKPIAEAARVIEKIAAARDLTPADQEVIDTFPKANPYR